MKTRVIIFAIAMFSIMLSPSVKSALFLEGDRIKAKIINPLNDYPSDKTFIINDKNRRTISVDTFNYQITLGCDVIEDVLMITKITFDPDDRYPEKMTFSDINGHRVSIPTNFLELSNADRSWVGDIFSEGDWVLVKYSICGSGGYVTDMISILKNTNRISSGGLHINGYRPALTKDLINSIKGNLTYTHGSPDDWQLQFKTIKFISSIPAIRIYGDIIKIGLNSISPPFNELNILTNLLQGSYFVANSGLPLSSALGSNEINGWCKSDAILGRAIHYSDYPDELNPRTKKAAQSICKAILVYKITSGERGLSLQDSLNTAARYLNTNADDYRFIRRVALMAAYSH